MAVIIQVRRGFVYEWENSNPILSEGEIGYEIDTNQIKIGNGIDRWLNLDYITGGTGTPIENPLTVKNGGTGVQSLNAYAVLCGGTSDTGAIQSIVSVGSQYQVLISNGPSSLPTMQLVTENSLSLSNNTTNNASTLKHGFVPILPDISTQFLNGQGNWNTPSVTENNISLSNNTTNNVSTLKHGFVPILPDISTQFLNGQGNWTTPDGAEVQSIIYAGAQYQVLISNGPSALPTMQLITESSISLSNNTTNNASTSKHGFAPILSDVPTQFLNGQGNWATPAGVVNSYLTQSFSNKTTINVMHGFNTYPIVQIIDNTGAVLIPLSIINNTVNDFTITFLTSTSGNIIASVGGPQPQSLIIINDNYTTLATDRIVQCTSPGKTITLLTAIGNAGREFIIDNHSVGNITVIPTGSEKIEDEPYQILPSNSAMNVYSDGTGYRIY